MSNLERNFAVGKGGHLFSLRYSNHQYNHKDEHQLDKFLLRLWQDPKYLVGFYFEHEDDICAEFFGYETFDTFIDKTIREAKRMLRTIYIAADAKEPDQLAALFKPLDDREHDRENYEQLKATGPNHKSWLRLYALQTKDDKIYIVGGAIKTVRKMKDREHLQKEVERLVSVRKELSAHIREGTIGELTISSKGT